MIQQIGLFPQDDSGGQHRQPHLLAGTSAARPSASRSSRLPACRAISRRYPPGFRAASASVAPPALAADPPTAMGLPKRDRPRSTRKRCRPAPCPGRAARTIALRHLRDRRGHQDGHRIDPPGEGNPRPVLPRRGALDVPGVAAAGLRRSDWAPAACACWSATSILLGRPGHATWRFRSWSAAKLADVDLILLAVRRRGRPKGWSSDRGSASGARAPPVARRAGRQARRHPA